MLRFTWLALGMTALALGFACTGSVREDRPTATAREASGLDTILLAESSREVGPVIFPHRRHHASGDQGGQAIACGICHHDIEDQNGPPPGSCRTCHPSHDSGEEAVAGYL